MNSNNSENPEAKYPKPPFKNQPQSPPGLSKLMDPQPDHGENSYQGHGLLQDKTVIITGGDSGIGRASAIAMAREGANIVIAYKDEIEDQDANDTAEWIKKAGREVILLRADLREESNCKKLVQQALDKFGKIDVLINNAAYQMTYKEIEDITAEEWNKTFEVNLSAMFYLVKLFSMI